MRVPDDAIAATLAGEEHPDPLGQYRNMLIALTAAQKGRGVYQIGDAAETRRVRGRLDETQQANDELVKYGRPLTWTERTFGFDEEQRVGNIFQGVLGSVFAGGAAGAVLDNPIGALGLLNPRRPPGYIPMTVFHGTPHRFAPEPDAPLGKFRLDKIGTGEGNQAFGHGIYVSESPGVARGYAKNVKESAKFQAMNTELRELARVMDAEEIPGQYRKYRSAAGEEAAKRYDEILAKRQAYLDDPGNFYKVDLPDSEIDKMLDWDAPLSEQPAGVRDALEQMGVRMDPPAVPWKIERDSDGYVIRSLRDDRSVAYRTSSLEAAKKQLAAMQDNAREMFQQQNSGASAYKEIADQVGQQEASQFLREAGIPGIKYKAGQFSGMQSDARNFVVFDPDIMKIEGVE